MRGRKGLSCWKIRKRAGMNDLRENASAYFGVDPSIIRTLRTICLPRTFADAYKIRGSMTSDQSKEKQS